jgi:hypothetical protein
MTVGHLGVRNQKDRLHPYLSAPIGLCAVRRPTRPHVRKRGWQSLRS